MIRITSIFLISLVLSSCNKREEESGGSTDWLLQPPTHGFVTSKSATKWEESLLTGNGTIGALVIGDAIQERVIFSHEKLFMPRYAPYPAPDLGSRLSKTRELLLDGRNEDAANEMIEAGKEVGITEDYMLWTDPLVPACQLEMSIEDDSEIVEYNRGVDYETGEAMVAWQTANGRYDRRVFTSRTDNAIVMKLSNLDGKKFNTRMKLAQLPFDIDNEELQYEDVIKNVKISVDEKGLLRYTTRFQKEWEGSLKGFVVESLVNSTDGNISSQEDELVVEDATTLTMVSRILLSYTIPMAEGTSLESINGSYDELLRRHSTVQSEMFNRFSLDLTQGENSYVSPEELIPSSSVGNLNNKLVEELCKAARYMLISSTGEIPPTLQGIWGGTWLPAWSGDFTLNGNVPSAIASGMNTNFQEVTEAYMDYMYSMYDDFEKNADALFGAPGIYVPSRSSSSGSTYHYGNAHPHLYWFAGGAWTSQFFFDYWQYLGDEEFLKNKVIPFMLASMEFYEFILVEDEEGGYIIIPSYSPEVGPLAVHPLTINATMDVAALKQLIRNLLVLEDKSYIVTNKVEKWTKILKGLPDYEIDDDDGDLKEWIWPGYKNDNAHRHASHLYPLFYEVDPEFSNNPELLEAARTAIDKRLEYRREKNGAEMAFGLVQIGLAAAHIGATDYAYECIDYLCNSYWSPSYTAYHDPGEIFNTDISGGLPALVTEMIVQSSESEISLLPALPEAWSDGEIKGVLTRCGVTIDLVWGDGKPISAKLTASRDTEFKIRFLDRSWEVNIVKGQSVNWLK